MNANNDYSVYYGTNGNKHYINRIITVVNTIKRIMLW